MRVFLEVKDTKFNNGLEPRKMWAGSPLISLGLTSKETGLELRCSLKAPGNNLRTFNWDLLPSKPAVAEVAR